MLRTRNAAFLLACAVLISICGCQSDPASRVAGNIRLEPPEQRQRVHVIFVESPVDVVTAGDMPGIARFVQCSGIPHVYYHNWYHDGGAKALTDQIRGIRCRDPQARIMLIGWSLGTLFASRAVEQLQQEGVCINTLVHLDSTYMEFTSRGHRPANVQRVVLIYRENNRPSQIPYDAMYLVDEHFHLAMPKRSRAMDALMSEIWMLSQGCQCVNCRQQAADDSQSVLP